MRPAKLRVSPKLVHRVNQYHDVVPKDLGQRLTNLSGRVLALTCFQTCP